MMAQVRTMVRVKRVLLPSHVSLDIPAILQQQDQWMVRVLKLARRARLMSVCFTSHAIQTISAYLNRVMRMEIAP
jgi:hypothetical protein